MKVGKIDETELEVKIKDGASIDKLTDDEKSLLTNGMHSSQCPMEVAQYHVHNMLARWRNLVETKPTQDTDSISTLSRASSRSESDDSNNDLTPRTDHTDNDLTPRTDHTDNDLTPPTNNDLTKRTDHTDNNLTPPTNNDLTRT